MKVTIKDREALTACEPELIKTYLIKKGWINEREVYVFNNDTIVFPTVIDQNYFSQVSWMLMVLEKAENRSQLDIWCDITNRTLFFGPGTEETLKEIDDLLDKVKEDNKELTSKADELLRRV
jgi:hypothetical protein